MTKIGDENSYMRSVHKSDYERTVSSYRYIIQRRDSILDRIRFGLVALHGASLVGLMSALSGKGDAAHWIGISERNAPVMAAMFVAGLLMAGFSAIRQQYVSTMEAADAFTRLISLERANALHESVASDDMRTRLQEAIEGIHRAPLVDFQFSTAAGIAQALSGGCWAAGIVIPLASRLHIW